MLWRAVMIAVLSLGLVGALRPEAEAHLAGTIKGIHYRSIVCVDVISGVPGTALGEDPSKPAFVECNTLVTRLEILCRNSQGHTVARSAGVNITAGASLPIGDDNITNKKKGVATVAIPVSDDAFLDPEFCTSHTWIPIEVLVTEFEVTVLVKQCTDSGCGTTVTASTETWDCVIPAGFSVENPPPSFDPDDPDPSKYQCTPGPKQHLR